MKNSAEQGQAKQNLKSQDKLTLRKRAAEDAVKDAESYVANARLQRLKTTNSKSNSPLVYALSSRHAGVRVGTEDGIDGLFIHSNEGKATLVLSDEISGITLRSEVEALAVEPIRIFHVQAPAPWVQQTHSGDA